MEIVHISDNHYTATDTDGNPPYEAHTAHFDMINGKPVFIDSNWRLWNANGNLADIKEYIRYYIRYYIRWKLG